MDKILTFIVNEYNEILLLKGSENDSQFKKSLWYVVTGGCIKYAFEELGLRRLENGYFKENEKFHKMQLRFGYKDEGIRRKRFVSKSTGIIEDKWKKI